jgi:nicotinamide-nucleotide amidase
MLLEETANLLFRNKKTVAIAESCTGGLICHTLTNINGSSKYFKLGLVLYSNEAKSKILNIAANDIERFGAVSGEIAILMAKKIRALARTDIGLSTTGIAGPTGGTKRNPVGSVYIALVDNKLEIVRKFRFRGTRTQIKNKAKDKALQLIKQCIENQ